MRLIIIPDVHGCLNQLENLIKFLEGEGYLNDRKLAMLGDYIDRGPQIRAMINFCIELQKDGHILICGNHEFALERALYGPTGWAATWFDNYEDRLLESFGLSAYLYYNGLEKKAAIDLYQAMTLAEREFIANLPLYYEDEHFVLVHAALLDSLSWEEQKSSLDTWDREQAEVPPQLRKRTLTLPPGFKKCLVTGHDPRRQPLITKNRVALDLAVFSSGKLPAWIPDANLIVTISHNEIWVDTALP